MGKTVAIIGAGIVGVSTALWLARAGHRPVLIDRDAPGRGASLGNGGVLAAAAILPVTGPGLWRKAPGMLMDRDQPLFLKWGYLPHLAPWLLRYLSHSGAEETGRIARALAPLVQDSLEEHRALSAGTAAERYLVPSDYVYLYDRRESFEAQRFGWDLRRAAGFRWREMGAEALKAYDPVFSDRLGFALALPDHGHVTDPGAYVKALATEAERLGARVLRADVTAILRDAGRVTGVRAGGAVIACDDVVLTAGAFSGTLADSLGLRVPLETERGYHIELWDPSHRPRAPVMVDAGKFVITPMDGRLRLAGVLELGGLERAPSRAPFDMLRRHLRRAMPDLRWSRETEWMGHRPATADSLPLIGAVPGLAGAWAGFGHHHVGLTAGPVTGRLLALMIDGQTPNLDMAPYAPARFGTGTAQ